MKENNIGTRFFLLPLFVFFLIITACPVFASPPQNVGTYEALVKAIRQTRQESKLRTQKAVEQEKVREAWEIGKLIDEHVLLHKERADYGKQVIKRLSGDLAIGEKEIYAMLKFARAYPIFPARKKLGWWVYKQLLSVDDVNEREEIMDQAEQENWTSRQVYREIQRRRPNQSPAKEVLQQAALGKPRTHRVIRSKAAPWKNELVLDLGFSIYHRPDGLENLNEGDMVTADSMAKCSDCKRSDLYTYPIHVLEIVDGDTLKAAVDLGFNMVTVQTLRLRGIDAPEIQTRNGEEAKAFLENLLSTAYRVQSSAKETQTAVRTTQYTVPVLIRTEKSDKYDRYLADLFVNGEYVNQKLLDEGLAVVMND